MPLGTNPLDTARIQSRLWSPRILNPTIWFDASDGLLPASAWKNKGSLPDAAISGTAAVYAPVTVGGSRTGKPTLSWTSLVGTGTAAITGAPTSTLVAIFTNASNVYVVSAGAANSAASFGSFPSVGIHLWNWPNGTLTNNVDRVSWLNGTLLAANAGGVTGATSGAGMVAFCGSTNSAGGGNAGRIVNFSSPTTFLANSSGLNRQAVSSWNEFIAVDRQLTTIEQAQVEGYLAWKWGYVSRLPASHTYQNRPPEIGA